MDIWRIIDVNLNRASEGLRVLDDIARFILNDADLNRQLRSIRHDVMDAASGATIELLTHRYAEQDIGADIESSPKSDLVTLARSNFKRVQEALRVLEETSKLPEIRGSLESDRFRKARFNIYALEKEMILKLQKATN